MRIIRESNGKWWMDIPGAKYIWHGEWSDPEILYKGFSINYWDAEEGALNMYREEHPEDKDDRGFDEFFKTLGGDGGYLHGELDDLVYAQLGDDGLDRKPWLGIKDANLVNELNGEEDGEHVLYKGCLVVISDIDYWDKEYEDWFPYSEDPEAFNRYYRGPKHRQELVDQLDRKVSGYLSESAGKLVKEEPDKVWHDDTKCDFCHKECGKTLYDGQTGFGSWAVMCELCFHEYGIGLGPGKGQKYKKVGSDYVKVEDKRKKSSKRDDDFEAFARRMCPELFDECFVNEASAMESGMKYFVDTYEAESMEDDPTTGMSNKVDAFWSMKDIPVKGRYDTIEDVLKAVCKANYFTYDRQRWFYDDYNNEFIGDYIVDKDNIEADADEIKRWENREMRLWNCRLTVHIMKSADALELDDSETSEWL